MKKLTILESEQLVGNSALTMIKIIGAETKITDYAVLLGGYIDKKKETGSYLTKTGEADHDVRIISPKGHKHYDVVYKRHFGIRPVIMLTSMEEILSNKTCKKGNNEIIEVEYGYYPRSIAPDSIQKKLNLMNYENNLAEAEDIYTTDSRKCDEYNKPFYPKQYITYEYENKKYIRVKANLYNKKKIVFQNRLVVYDNDYYWVEVEPVKWLVDDKEKIMISKEIIIAGIQYHHDNEFEIDFQKSNIKKYIDEYLSKELFQNQYNITLDNRGINNKIINEYTNLIQKLYKKGYTGEQIRDITNSILKEEKINCKKKTKCYTTNENK